MKDVILIKDVLFDGNNLCLDFINTIHNRHVKAPIDYLVGLSDWVEWLQRKEVLRAELRCEHALFDLQNIKQFRELLYRIFYGVLTNKEPLIKDISEFNRYLLKLRKATSFSIENGIPAEYTHIDTNNLNSYLLLIVDEAHQLLIHEKISHVKECDNCGWLFLDISKSKKRKWCNMKTCGNEVKARRHYQRVKDEKRNIE